jgi:putative peptidoglycan lipid II flippase
MAAALNAERRFGLAALAPVIVNVALVGLLGAILASGLAQGPGARLLALGVSLAGALQLIWLTLALRRAWSRWPFGRPVWSPDMGRLAAMAIPGVIASGATQLAIVVATLVASTVPGAVSWLYYADRVYQLPLGFVAVAMGTVLLPDLAARVRAGDHDGERTTIDAACEMALLLTVPAGIALAILAEPIVAVLFERGAFAAGDSAATAAALRLLALGLPGAVLAKVLAQPFFAREQPTIPLLAALGVVALTLLGGLLLVAPMGVGGIALAVSLAATAQAGVLGIALEKRGIARPGIGTFDRALRIALASGVMGASVAVMARAMHGWFDAALPFAVKGSALGLVCLAGLAIYLAVAHALGAIAPELVSRARKGL